MKTAGKECLHAFISALDQSKSLVCVSTFVLIQSMHISCSAAMLAEVAFRTQRAWVEFAPDESDSVRWSWGSPVKAIMQSSPFDGSTSVEAHPKARM